ncbi:choice-of-anchor Q domain-containing protein [Tundrisphaera sp. TA3]|uniref:choice-of-anchor Q domain-containing protein n=1 Tax=Tundrisphaera sp. TA3 TaxID=3435775 RepID=UPI003EBD7D30
MRRDANGNRRGIRRAFGLAPRPEPLEGRAVPATLLVTSTGDAGPGTLRDAIERANLDPGGDTIAFAPSVVGEIGLASALPDLSTDIAMAGPGSRNLTVTRGIGAGPSPFRIFTVTAFARVEITGLTISGGQAETGGGIDNAGTLRLADATVSGNQAQGRAAPDPGGGIRAGDGRGGGINNAGTMTIENARIEGNRANGSNGEDLKPTPSGAASGGGIANSGTMTIADTTIDRNSANGGGQFFFRPGAGGGIENLGTLTVIRSTLSNNESFGGSSNGGGIANAGTATITTSTFSRNSSNVTSGYGSTGRGGAIDNGGLLTVTSSTLVGNFAGGRLTNGPGDGIYNAETGRIAIGSTILANYFESVPSFGRNVFNMNGRVTSLGHNLFTDAPEVPLDPTDLVNTDPILSPLGDFGGPTWTHAPVPGSPAIDAGAASADPGTDQRGVARPQGSAPDIGAFESRGFVIAIQEGDDQSATVGSTFARPLAVTVTSPFGEPVAGGRVNFAAPSAGASIAGTVGTETIDADGRAAVQAVANGIAGSYAVFAGTSGAAGIPFRLTNRTDPGVGPRPDRIGPAVVGFRRSNFGRRNASLTLAFGEPLDPARASDLANYRLVGPGRDGRFGTRDDLRIRIRSADYDQATATVTLRPPARLILRGRFRLTLNGMPPGGIADAAGHLLDGDGDGRPGGDFVATFREPAKAGRR